ncbi:hypothetical protein [Streptomyces sp. CB01881]|uniref:hypothetical protein n=1 Tax=Streptomyces sp. CB01881 TaxID=2078691 RepID=UPI000CDC10A6|nr:hypothetical protein [Streptomyces sp. CB01881]AUY53819.1 hypothetical protein C2142_38965 [Streptomyces sp. CB01881]TYC68827.1 hypothetical protein EH183_38960 [Streptomyces sp. CB01881]
MTRLRGTGILRFIAPVLALLATACGPPDAKPTMTRDQAKQRTESYFTDTFAILPQPVNAVAERDGDATCFKDDAPSEKDGRVMAMTSRYLRGIPADHHAATFDAFREHLVQAGFNVTTSGPGSIFLENPKDGFGASIQDGGDWATTLTIGFGSPCVWPNGTKPPLRPTG